MKIIDKKAIAEILVEKIKGLKIEEIEKKFSKVNRQKLKSILCQLEKEGFIKSENDIIQIVK